MKLFQMTRRQQTEHGLIDKPICEELFVPPELSQHVVAWHSEGGQDAGQACCKEWDFL